MRPSFLPRRWASTFPRRLPDLRPRRRPPQPSRPAHHPGRHRPTAADVLRERPHVVPLPDGGCDLPLRERRARGRGSAGRRHLGGSSRKPGPLPPGSRIADVGEARRFARPLPYTFHHEPRAGRLLSVRGVRSSWDPQPVAVDVRELSFFSAERFGEEPVLANAFYVADIDYRWQRGRFVS